MKHAPWAASSDARFIAYGHVDTNVSHALKRAFVFINHRNRQWTTAEAIPKQNENVRKPGTLQTLTPII